MQQQAVYPVGYLPVETSEGSTSVPRTAKKKPKQKKAKQQQPEDPVVVETFAAKSSLSAAPAEAAPDAPLEAVKATDTLGAELVASPEQPATTTPAKRVRNLKKKLREISELEESARTGKALTEEQRQKISRRKEIEEEIAQLEMGAKE